MQTNLSPRGQQPNEADQRKLASLAFVGGLFETLSAEFQR